MHAVYGVGRCNSVSDDGHRRGSRRVGGRRRREARFGRVELVRERTEQLLIQRVYGFISLLQLEGLRVRKVEDKAVVRLAKFVERGLEHTSSGSLPFLPSVFP